VRAFGACLMEWRRRRKLWRDGWMTKRISIDSLVYLSSNLYCCCFGVWRITRQTCDRPSGKSASQSSWTFGHGMVPSNLDTDVSYGLHYLLVVYVVLLMGKPFWHGGTRSIYASGFWN
jgi:hypothetical protein